MSAVNPIPSAGPICRLLARWRRPALNHPICIPSPWPIGRSQVRSARQWALRLHPLSAGILADANPGSTAQIQHGCARIPGSRCIQEPCRQVRVNAGAVASVGPGPEVELWVRFQEFDDLRAHSPVSHTLERFHIVVGNDGVGICNEFVESRLVPRDAGALQALRIIPVPGCRPRLSADDLVERRSESIVALLR